MSTPCPPIQPDGIMPLPCSGACSVGQLSHQAVIELTGAGFGRMYSLAAIAAGLAAAIADAGKARMVVAVDGCERGAAVGSSRGPGSAAGTIWSSPPSASSEDSLRIDNDNLQLVKDAIQACCAEARPIIRLGGCMCGI